MERLAKMATYPAPPTCPLDGHELDIHFHGGVECPVCGAEYELGRNDELLPLKEHVEQAAATWPDTIPQDWKLAMAERTGQPQVMYHDLPIRDPGLETSLEDHGFDPQTVQFQKVMVPLAQFEPKGIDAAFGDDPDHLEYTRRLLPWLEQNPDRWTVAIDPQGGLIDGWHRVNLAHDLGETEIPAWQVVDTPASSQEGPTAPHSGDWTTGVGGL